MGETVGANGTPAPPTMRRNDVSMTDMSDIDTGDRLYHVRKSRLIRLINWWEVRSSCTDTEIGPAMHGLNVFRAQFMREPAASVASVLSCIIAS